MSTSETAPLNPPSLDAESDERDSLDLDDTREILETSHFKTRRGRDPMYLLVLYGISCFISLGALSCSLWGYCIIRTAPFDEGSRRDERESYERNFLGMQSILVFNTINIIYSGFNFWLALKGSQEQLWMLNMVYDFFLWALLIAFGVLNMIVALLDRRLCDGLPRKPDGTDDHELYEICDAAMFRLLVVELVAVNLGLLLAVLHFILLIGRCCTSGPLLKSWTLRARIREEKRTLMILMHRRQRLIEENQELESGSGSGVRPLPPLPTGMDVIDAGAENEIEPAEDLIDMVAAESEESTRSTRDENV